MSLTAIVRKVFATRQRELEKHFTQAEALQRAVLSRLVNRASDTEYGRQHAFTAISGYDDFTRQVPVNSYEELKEMIDRMRHGERDVLWPGQVKWYAKSSGTTNDKSKFIPVSSEGLQHIHYAGGWDTVALYLRNNPQSRLFDGRALILGGSHAPNYNLKDSLVGDLSAILIENINPLVNLVRVPKKKTALLSDFEVKRDRIAREAMNRNVTNLSGVPSWMLSVLSRVMELSGKQHLEEVWPNLEVFFHGGVAFTPYREQYERLITSDKMHYMETYNASEGFFGLQDDPSDKSMLLMLDYDVFYEFQEMGTNQIVPLWGVEPGKNYAMLISTSCGLWRYMLGDTVRFTSRNPYKFIISGRTKHFINAFGEELIVDNAEQGLAYACQQTGAQVKEYTAAPVFMDEKARCHHQWLVEFVQEPADLEQFARLLDERLQQVNSDYEAKRFKNITLQPLELVKARPGLFDEWMKQRGKLGGQNKVPRLSNTREHIEQLLSLNVRKLMLTLLACLAFVGCARMGSPDGGWYDDTPPKVIAASPEDRAIEVKNKKVAIQFDEFIKLEDAQNKVIVSPPQLEMPEIKVAGKRILVELKDSLKPNTTYTIDFSDGISDNNEGNPMGNYTYCFSTGTSIDTMEVGGYVLDAENLEPVKGILVGVYREMGDSTLRKEPMLRISRTDSRGHFTVKGVAKGRYYCSALQDADGDFVYSQKSEVLAFNNESFEPWSKPDFRQDTIWLDTLHIDRVMRVPYTHFMPDELTLLAFQAVQSDRFLLKTERQDPRKLGFYFTYGNPELPKIEGLNFDSDNAFMVETNLKQDTIFYWLRDTTLVNRDTLEMAVTYLMTDTLGMLVSQTDTLEMLPKTPYAKRMKEREKELEKWQKEQDKKKKKGEKYDSVYPVKPLTIQVAGASNMSPEGHVILESPTPLLRCDTAGIHLYSKVDTLWYQVPYRLKSVNGSCRRYEVMAEWRQNTEYSLETDSTAFTDIYGQAATPSKQGIKVKGDEEFGSLFVNMTGHGNTGRLMVQMLSSSDVVVKQVKAKNGSAEFYYVQPGKYYLRAFDDRNNNGIWDTGDYDAKQQPEDVYYCSDEIECKAKFDINHDWNLTAKPRFRQKPMAITKQKPEKEKQLRNRNAERAKQLGIKYINEKTGINL